MQITDTGGVGKQTSKIDVCGPGLVTTIHGTLLIEQPIEMWSDLYCALESIFIVSHCPQGPAHKLYTGTWLSSFVFFKSPIDERSVAKFRIDQFSKIIIRSGNWGLNHSREK